MPRVNIDNMVKGLFEPIEFELDGVLYTVGTITQELAEELIQTSQGGDLAGVRTVLARLCGVDPKVFKRGDFFKVMGAAMFVTRTITEQTKAFVTKNMPGEGVDGTQS